MPYVRVETNVQPADVPQAVRRLSAAVAEALGKQERWVMAHLVPGAHLAYGGTDAPAAYVQLESIGLAVEQCAALSEAICAHLGGSLGVPPERIYIDFKDVERARFGWNGLTF